MIGWIIIEIERDPVLGSFSLHVGQLHDTPRVLTGILPEPEEDEENMRVK